MGCIKLHILDEQYKRTDLKVRYFNKELTPNFCAEKPYRWTLIMRVDPTGLLDGEFTLNGKIIGNDGKNDGKVYALKNALLTGKDIRETQKFIKNNSGNEQAFKDNNIAYKNSIEIEGKQGNRQQMFNIVGQDNGLGGTNPANNREYGGYIENGNVIEATPGPVGNPKTDSHLNIDLPSGKTTFHGHASGTLSEYNMDFNSVNNTSQTYHWEQTPSPADVNHAGSNTRYVFGQRDGMLYIYNGKGVQATMPSANFVKFRK